MKKKDLLEDIQKKIDICDQHISQNPYPPAQKRVGYIINNKCKASNIPFYLNAVYNQEQLKLNTDLEQRRKLLRTVTKEFTLADIPDMSIDVTLFESLTKQKQKLIEGHYQTEDVSTGKKNIWGNEKTVKHKIWKKEKWIDIVENIGGNELKNIYAEETKKRHFNSLGEAVQFYKTIKKQIGKKVDYDNEIDDDGKVRIRYKNTHVYSVHAYFNFNDYIIKLVKDTRQEEEGIKGTENQPVTEIFNWEFYTYQFLRDSNEKVKNVSNEDKRVQITSDLQKLTNKKVNTNVYDPKLNKLESEYDDIADLYYTRWTKVYQAYEQSYTEYKELYDKTKTKPGQKTDSKVEKKYKEVNKKLDQCFDIIERYESQITNSSLLDLIKRYHTHQDLVTLYKNQKPVKKQEVKKIADVEDTESYKKLLSRQAEMQNVLKTGNQKLQEYYKSEIDKYSKQTEQYKKKVEQNEKDIEEYKKYLENFKGDVIAYQSQLQYLYIPENLDFFQINALFRQFLLTKLMELEDKVVEQQKVYDAAKAAKLKEYKDSPEFQASEIKFKVNVLFMPDGIPYYTYMETIASSFIFEDLQNKIKDIVEGQNEQKKNEVYYNAVGKTEYEQHQRELKEITDKLEELRNENLVIEKTLTFKEAAVQQLQTEHPIALEQALLQDPYLKTGYYYSVDNAYNEKISSAWEEIKTLQNQYNGNNMDIAMMSQQQSILIQQCRAYSENSVPYTKQSAKYKIYDERDDLQSQLDIINTQIQQVEVIRAKQVKLNQNIITTNQNYVEANTNCQQKIIDLEKLMEEGVDFNNPEVIKLNNQIDYYNSLRIQYSSQLETQKNEYLNNNNFLKSTKDFKDRKKAIEEQLAEINQKIDQLEAPQVQQKIGVTDDGTKYQQGYNFSSTGLYKNIYIDIQTENEWLTFRQELKKLYSYYNINLPDGEIEEPKTSEEEKKSFPLLNQAGEITLFEDNNDNCKCNWFIPMDYEIFGSELSLPLKLTTKVYKTDEKGEKIEEYDEKGQFTGFMTQRRQMAVQNGYGYIFTGQYVTLYYTGLPGPEPISITIPGVGLEYGALFAGGYVAVTPYNIYQMKRYPYQNTDPLGQFYWLQIGVATDIYKTVMGKLPIEVTFKIYKKIPLPCGYPKKCGRLTEKEYAIRGKCGLRQFFENTHDIFTKLDEKDFDIGTFMDAVEGDITETINTKSLLSEAKDAARKGLKGIMGDAVAKASSDLLSNISNLTRSVDDKFEKVYNLYRKNTGEVGGRAAQFMQTKRNIAQWGNTSLNLVQNTWNITDALDSVESNKKEATQQAQNIMSQMNTELIDLIPPECQDSICNTIREAQQDSIKDLGLSVNEATKINVDTLTFFVEKSVTNMTNDLKDKAGKVLDGIQNVGQFIGKSVANLVDTSKFDFFSLTQYCPRRLSDVTKDINPLNQPPSATPIPGTDLVEIPESGPDIFSQIGSMIGQELIGNVMNALNNCVTRSITNNNINYSSLFPEETRKYLEAANSAGDIVNMAKGIGGYNMSLENLFHEANRSSILDNFANINTDDISLGYLTDFLNERGISDIIDTDKYLSSNETIDTLKNTISKAVSNNNDIIDKLGKGEILSMNDQYKQIASEKLNEKTQEWAKRISDKVNAVTGIGQNAKGLLNTDFSKAWKDPHEITNKLQNITGTMKNMFMKEQAKKKKENNQMKQAFSMSDELIQTKNYLKERWEYLEKLTKQEYSTQKEEVNNLSINI